MTSSGIARRAGVIALAVMGSIALLRASAAEPVRTHTVVIESMKFTPEVVRVRPGDRVVFRNDDFVPHTATAVETKLFDSQLIKPGESWTLPLDRGLSPQQVRYSCSYHPTMQGRITVESP